MELGSLGAGDWADKHKGENGSRARVYTSMKLQVAESPDQEGQGVREVRDGRK